MKILMLGWELPPYNSGGLGEACLGLTKALSEKSVELVFVLPQKVNASYDHMKVVFANLDLESMNMKTVYSTSLSFMNEHELSVPLDFVSSALAYAQRIKSIVNKYDFDIIHSHDWLTLPAGVEAKRATGKPLVAHIHATEFDRSGGHFPNPYVYKIEKEGLMIADKVLSVSEFTKNILVEKYGISSDKIEVVHNGVDPEDLHKKRLTPTLTAYKEQGYKVVLYLGRITLQKGPEYFVRAAKIVLEYDKKVLFVVAGSGDMHEQMMNEAVSLGIHDSFMFTGFLRGEEKDRLWQSADLYVMPSVSEPFGLTSIESIANETPVLISKQSGASEVLKNVLKVDFWDVDEMANKILGVISYPSLGIDMRLESKKELPNITWYKSADKVCQVYKELI